MYGTLDRQGLLDIIERQMEMADKRNEEFRVLQRQVGDKPDGQELRAWAVTVAFDMMRHVGWQGTDGLLETAAALVAFVKGEK